MFLYATKLSKNFIKDNSLSLFFHKSTLFFLIGSLSDEFLQTLDKLADGKARAFAHHLDVCFAYHQLAQGRVQHLELGDYLRQPLRKIGVLFEQRLQTSSGLDGCAADCRLILSIFGRFRGK